MSNATLIANKHVRQFPSYTKFKDSGIEWLGEIPDGWGVMRIAAFATKITNGYVGPTRDILVDEGIKYLQSLHIKNNRIQFDDKYYVTEVWSKQHGKSILKKDDVLIVQTGDIGQVACVPKEYEGVNCHALIIVSCSKNYMDGKYLAWLLNSSYGFHSLKCKQTGALHPHLNCTYVREIKIPVPSSNEQRKITNFIDLETLRIDTLISKKERQIELLHEKRSALISHAVTKGLDPHVKMKDSGIEWLGEIPEGWRVVRCKYVLWLQRGHDLPVTEFIEGNYPVCGSNGCIGYHSHFTTEGPGITIGRSGSVGEVNYIKKDYWAHNTALYVKEFRQAIPRYVFYLLTTLDVKYLSEGTAVGTLNRNYIHDLPIAIPVVDEQHIIASFLDHETEKIDTLIEKIKLSIEKLREFRTALISAAVTGKIDVREEVV